MLAIFQKGCAHPPQELNSPTPPLPGMKKPRNPNEILNDFLSISPTKSMAMTFGDGTILGHIRPESHGFVHQRLLCGFEDVYCLFLGNLNNLSSLIKQYGLSRVTNEAMVIIEAYRTLRDRGPYPADQVVKDLEGNFAFVIYDSKAGHVFVALGSDGAIQLYWGIAADGSVVISEKLETVKANCGKSFAPFPAGCMFHSEGGLMSFEHPLYKVKPMPRVDSEGMMGGATFKVDVCTKIAAMPRVGSSADWTTWTSSH